MSRKKSLVLLMIACVLLIYCLFPRYRMDFGGWFGYRIMDGYAKDYYIECGGHMLIRKNPSTLTGEDKNWLKKNLPEVYNERISKFDKDGGYLIVMNREGWVDSFKYAFSRFDEDGNLVSDVYESIAEYDGMYYQFEYDYPFKGIQYGRLDFYDPQSRKLIYHYNFYVERSKDSCSNPQ